MSVLMGRLGLETARVPHADRAGLLWLSRGDLHVKDGCIHFRTGGFNGFPSGDYAIPHQNISAILLGPGSTLSHDAGRILARHGTCLLMVGEDGVRLYTSPPLKPDRSALARAQMRLWADPETRIMVARRMYAWRFGEVLPIAPLDTLRGMEGARVKKLYAALSDKYGVQWQGRDYDRSDPGASDDLNAAINHAATAAYAAAAIAVSALGCIPQLGFIHEDSGDSLCLDMADLYRMSHVVPCAFKVVAHVRRHPGIVLERHVRQECGKLFTEGGLIEKMIGKLKELFDASDASGHT